MVMEGKLRLRMSLFPTKRYSCVSSALDGGTKAPYGVPIPRSEGIGCHRCREWRENSATCRDCPPPRENRRNPTGEYLRCSCATFPTC